MVRELSRTTGDKRQMLAYNFRRKSENTKTGPIPVTITAKESCWAGCPFMNNGCYAEQSFLGITWAQIGKPPTHAKAPKSISLDTLCERVAALPAGQLWRHNQAGDLPGENGAIDAPALGRLVAANKGRRGFTYTHKPTTTANLAAIKQANAGGFTINLSGNNLNHEIGRAHV